MTQRSILAVDVPTVILRSGGTVHVEGWASDRVRAATDDRRGLKVERRGDSIVVEARGDLDVKAPLASVVDVLAGHDIEIRGVHAVSHATAGKDIRLECETIEGSEIAVTARGNVRFQIQRLRSTRVIIEDRGGHWEVNFGGKTTTLHLKAEGDVTLVTSQNPDEMPAIVGNLERPISE